MFRKIFRKLKSVIKCFHSKITIVKQNNFSFEDNKGLQLVIIRRQLQNGKPFNTVWLIGSYKHLLHKIYHWSGEPTRFSKRYDISMRIFDYWMIVRKPHQLYRLCRKLKIKKIVIIHYKVSNTNFSTPSFLQRN